MQFADDVGTLKFSVGDFRDKLGQPAADPGVATFTSSDETVATVAADPSDPNGDSAIVTVLGALGQAQISADYNGGANGGGFSVVGALEIVPGAAVSATGTFAPIAP